MAFSEPENDLSNNNDHMIISGIYDQNSEKMVRPPRLKTVHVCPILDKGNAFIGSSHIDVRRGVTMEFSKAGTFPKVVCGPGLLGNASLW